MRTPHWLHRGSRWLAGHVARLRQTLDALGRRLRDTVAVAVGQTVAGAVREAIHAVLTDFAGEPQPGSTVDRVADHGRALWDRPGRGDPDGWLGGPEDFDPDDADADPAGASDVPDHAGPDRGPKPLPRWPLAVVVGCNVVTWWLKRRLAKLPALAAVAVGVLSALAAYAGSPLTLAGSALGLAGTASALGVFGPG
jgi:hypothetical protein